jgi:hypothetical protein
MDLLLLLWVEGSPRSICQFSDVFHMPARYRKAMLYRRGKLSMGKADFQGSADSKPLDRLTPNFECMTNVLKSCYKSTFITITLRVSSAQYGEVAHFFVTPAFFTSYHEPPPERAGRFAKLMPQTTSFATRKCLLGVSSMKKIF